MNENPYMRDKHIFYIQFINLSTILTLILSKVSYAMNIISILF